MLTSITIDPAVHALRPDAVVLALVATGLPGGPSDDGSRAALAEATLSLPVTPPEEHPNVIAWREAYRAFGAKPQRTRCSVEALMRRGGLPEVNRLVDLYNVVSVRHVLPVGGEDLSRYRGAARLLRAEGTEPFEVLEAGVPAIDHPSPGEVVWCDDEGVTCRRWNWRQCVRTRITEDTTEALFLLERLAPMTLDALREAGEDLTKRLRDLSPAVRIESRLIGA
ncbi:B3/B4 domain-containing protein [Embleya scabrispora]|uniref:B3/B4 domain-containing protein n=1 Tax=Embleya scabrispora TaxID=159449 RepID=UPI0003689D41|nr:phenylalanine--tRNA ligase beta subunit-related protein [Embleya scabrispora]MYS83616.1 cytoplasmic protein [Streptomyces sp. SID5474]